MQLRCTYCQTMFAISHEEMLASLEHMEETRQVYTDAHCPNCRRANRVERNRMERFFPDWKNAIKVMEKTSTQAKTLTENSTPTPVPAKPIGAIKTAVKAKPASKPAAKAKSIPKTTEKAKNKPAPRPKEKSAGSKKK